MLNSPLTLRGDGRPVHVNTQTHKHKDMRTQTCSDTERHAYSDEEQSKITWQYDSSSYSITSHSVINYPQKRQKSRGTKGREEINIREHWGNSNLDLFSLITAVYILSVCLYVDSPSLSSTHSVVTSSTICSALLHFFLNFFLRFITCITNTALDAY